MKLLERNGNLETLSMNHVVRVVISAASEIGHDVSAEVDDKRENPLMTYASRSEVSALPGILLL